MNKLLFLRLLILWAIGSYGLSAAKGNPLDSVPGYTYTVVVDTISTRYPDLKIPFSCTEAGLIDMKRFNDTLFLFVIPANQDTLTLYTLFFDNKFILKEKRPIRIKTHALSFVQPSWSSLTMIHYDTIALIGEHEALFYDMVNQDLFFTHHLEEHQHFTSYDSPIQHIPGTSFVVSEFLDFGANIHKRIAAIDYKRQAIHPLPFYYPENEHIKSITAGWNFRVMEEKIADKYSFLNHFCVWHPVTQQVDEVPVAPHGLPAILYVPTQEDLANPVEMTRAQFQSHQQIGMAYNRDKETLTMIYMLPANENDIQGLRIPSRDILCLVYDTRFKTKGKLELQYPYVFLPTLFFSFDDRLFLFMTSGNFLAHIVKINE